MALPIEDYAVIGDTRTAALIGRDGSIDWLCLPRFDSGACFAALLGEPRHGRWLLAPAGEVTGTRRRYRDGTLVLETELDTDGGTVRLIECMPRRLEAGIEDAADVVRLVEGVRGRVQMRSELGVRFDYGSAVPWVTVHDTVGRAVAGPDAVEIRSPVPVEREGHRLVSEFSVGEGDRVPMTLTWHPSHRSPPDPVDVEELIDETTQWWSDWSRACRYEGPWREHIVRSLVTLKALTYEPTGGIVAAATTSLPEHPGGVRNWDYRICWVRDATFTLEALQGAGYREEAVAWRDWLLRAVAGTPSAMQIMYGPAGERRLPEMELDWLPGYEGSSPVRIGNAAVEQVQLDTYGEVMDALATARREGMEPEERAWLVQHSLIEHLEGHWDQPDHGIWEMRGGKEHFTHSKVMAWVAFDRAVRSIERYDLDGPVERWRAIRDEIHHDVCKQGYDAERGTFTMYYGADVVDANLLMIPLVGFLPADDERVRGTVATIERELCMDGFVARYPSGHAVDGLPEGEGAFLPCSFWLAHVRAMQGRRDAAVELFERLLGVCNDVGLLAEEYDPGSGRLLGNFPQAFSHVGLVNTAFALVADTPEPARSHD